MKRTLIITGIVMVSAFLLLFVLNKFTSKRNTPDVYTTVQKGLFEIGISSAGELVAEKSVDIKCPDFAAGRDIRVFAVRIQDIVAEGTMVKEGEYIATLDRTDLNNNLKDALENLTKLQNDLSVKLLDSAVTHNDRRDDIRNQRFAVEEAEMTLHNSKFEPPTTIRQAEIALDKSRRVLEQKERSYIRKVAQSKADIQNQTYLVKKMERRVSDIQEILAGFTVTAPSPGMILYKRDWNGTKRKAGSMVNPFDRVIATLPDLATLMSKTYVSEIDINKVKAGQKVSINIDALPDKKINGTVSFVASIGEKLQNSNDKVFEVQIRLDEIDPVLRPSMTTGNKISVSSVNDALFIPIECVHAGVDSIPYVFTKKGQKQIVIPGETNDKNVIIEKGLTEGTMIYLDIPEKPDDFKITGEDLIPVLREKKSRTGLARM
jgi:HlyD family secretion protein